VADRALVQVKRLRTVLSGVFGQRAGPGNVIRIDVKNGLSRDQPRRAPTPRRRRSRGKSRWSLPTLKGTNCPSLAKKFCEFFERPLVDLRRALASAKIGRERWRAKGAGFEGKHCRCAATSPGTLLQDNRAIDDKTAAARWCDQTERRNLAWWSARPRRLFPVAIDAQEHRRRGKIAVPQIVVHALKCQRRSPVSAFRAIRQFANRSSPMRSAPIEIECRRARRDENNATLDVNGHASPVVGSSAGFPCIFRPRFVANSPG